MLCLPDIARSSLLMWKNVIQIFLLHNHFVRNCFVIVRKNKQTKKQNGRAMEGSVKKLRAHQRFYLLVYM